MPVRAAYGAASAAAHAPVGPIETEEELAARTLADYGTVPRSWIMTPFYAYRVLRRQRELERALVGRKEEAALAVTAAEDALVACGERARARVKEHAEYKRSLTELTAAEELLRSRDTALAKEQDAHAERIKSIDVRISKLEEELADAKSQERQAAGALADAEAALKRAEAKMKRAEIELRNANAAQRAAEKGA
jgi:hypothetical protein